jgi:hypothetical protein
MDFEPLPAISIRHRVAMLSSSVPEDLQTLLSIRRRVLIWLLSQAFLPHYFKEGTGAGGNHFNLSSISNQAHPATFLVRSLIEVDSPCDINLLMTMWRKPLVLPERFHDLLKTLIQEIEGIKGMKGSEVEELRGSEEDSQSLQRVWVSDNVYNTRKVKVSTTITREKRNSHSRDVLDTRVEGPVQDEQKQVWPTLSGSASLISPTQSFSSEAPSCLVTPWTAGL